MSHPENIPNIYYSYLASRVLKDFKPVEAIGTAFIHHRHHYYEVLQERQLTNNVTNKESYL